MRTAEKNLLLAVRDRLTSAGGFTAAQCMIEPFSEAPATVADICVLIGPLGWKPGPRHSTSSGVRDLIYSIGAFVARRTTAVPRGRLWDAFALQSGALSDEIDKLFAAIDWKYEVTVAANALILNEAGSSEGFIKPLVFSGMDAEPRVLSGDFFGASSDSVAGLGRLVRFDGARRITTI